MITICGGGLLLLVGLVSMRIVAHQWGVEEVPLPRESEIEIRAGSADYTDAYRYRLPDFHTIDEIERLAFQKGREVARSQHELVYEGGAPGLRFLISYHIDGEAPDQMLTLSTAVFYESWLGWLYFSPVKVVHRQGVPFMTAFMVRGTPDRP